VETTRALGELETSSPAEGNTWSGTGLVPAGVLPDAKSKSKTKYFHSSV